MVDRELVQSFLLQLREKVDLLRKAMVASLPDFEKDPILQNAVLHLLQTAVEICLDVGQHVIADEGWRAPTSNRDVFQILGEEGVLESETVAKCQNMAAFRNLVVHLYEKVNLADVYAIWSRHLGDFRDFASAVQQFLRRSV